MGGSKYNDEATDVLESNTDMCQGPDAPGPKLLKEPGQSSPKYHNPESESKDQGPSPKEKGKME